MHPLVALSFFLWVLPLQMAVVRAELRSDPALDRKVNDFLDSHRGSWRDMNVPFDDGKLLHDLILRNGYTHALEIGTSTGHSGVWIAWALSKTGGKLITIEIDKDRHRQAVENFKKAGLADYIDARLANAHELAPKLEGPFDFVFCDADKGWYKNYVSAVLPKLEVNGCFTAHNVSNTGWGRYGWVADFLEFLQRQPDLETTFAPASSAGMSISYKRAK